MAIVSSLGFFILLLSLHCICVFGAWSGGEFQKKQELERQRAEQASQLSSSNGRKTKNVRRRLDEFINPPATTYPSTTPTANPSNFPPYAPTPTIVTVPSSNPILLTPFNPANPNPTPITTDPSTTNPYPIPTPNPATPGINPVTTYPTPVPVYVPVTTPSTQTAANAPIIPGQTWCIARAGVPESSLQQGLDYACGIGGADCSMIQEGASCYYPASIENHASYAFNSYFQRNPVPSSCDFGGTAMLVNTDPSTGSCMFPSSATPAALPSSTSPPATTTSSSGATGSLPGVGGYGFMPPPPGFNTYNPASGSPTSFGPDSPPISNSVPAGSAPVQPFMGFTILVASLSTGKLVLNS